MRRLFGISVLTAALAVSTSVMAQTPQTPAQPSSGSAGDEPTRPATTTVSGTTGIWYVPTSEVLPAKKWSMSLYRTNIDYGQGFTDVSTFPVTFAVGLGNRAELFGSWSLATRIDRDSRPLFFTPANSDAGTNGGILVDHPGVHEQWTGNKLGDLWLGGKVNLMAGSTSSAGFGVPRHGEGSSRRRRVGRVERQGRLRGRRNRVGLRTGRRVRRLWRRHRARQARTDTS